MTDYPSPADSTTMRGSPPPHRSEDRSLPHAAPPDDQQMAEALDWLIFEDDMDAATRARFDAWLENHRLFGPILHNWRNGRAVARRASLAMLVALAIMLITLPHGIWLYGVILGMAVGNLWIWSRPDSPWT